MPLLLYGLFNGSCIGTAPVGDEWSCGHPRIDLERLVRVLRPEGGEWYCAECHGPAVDLAELLRHRCVDKHQCKYCTRHFRTRDALESHEMAMSGTRGLPVSRYVVPAVVGTPMTLDTVLLTNSAEFKEKVIRDLMGAASGCKVRIQAYHFDCLSKYSARTCSQQSMVH